MRSFEDICKHLDRKLDHDDIDEFLIMLNKSIRLRLDKLNNEHSSVNIESCSDPDGYKEHLLEQVISTEQTKILGDELSIIALYKKTEKHINMLIRYYIKSTNSSSSINELIKILQPSINLKSIKNYAAFEELRLLNNGIKHGGKVSELLSKVNKKWTKHEDIKNLDGEYQRLLPQIEEFIYDLAHELQAL